MRTYARRPGRAVLAVAAAVAALALAPAGPQPAAARPAALQWGACPKAAPGSMPADAFECAKTTVPQDYGAPGKGRFTLALIRHPASDRKGRLGTLFWNPGGPGDAGTRYLPVAVTGFPEEVRRRFDIVSWDPRGMGGGTTPVVQCFDSAAAEADFTAAGAPQGGVPRTDAQMTAYLDFQKRLNERCVGHAGDLLAHVSTADNARDLDRLRQAVGEEEITYYGTSYGTFLGATYLNMFPDHVRAAVLDGAVFPTAWAARDASDPDLSTFLRVGSDVGAARTMDEFVHRCGLAGPAKCSFAAGSVAATRQKWDDLLARITREPVTVDGQDLDGPGLEVQVQSALYTVRPVKGFDRFPGWSAVADTVQEVWKASGQPRPAGTAPPPPSSRTQQPPASPAAAPYTTSAGRQRSVICGESPNPGAVPEYVDQAKTSEHRAGVTGWPWAAVCAGWTARAADPYRGPWNTAPDVPVLVVGNTFDPATPYASSARTARELPGARFLTVNGFGHTELLNPSRCAQDRISALLTDGTLPPEGTVCRQDGTPFG
ncbi:alpha/beta hydrolase [Streptomyces sp. NPDC093225]|uniref:alpha/beta hydrolase n=1 Tax=Streptomyces sp. NPDC093225 TaxID=3366034 RepID=UPI0038119254